ncbi:putative two-component sensor histidine kinase (plasmid) [Acidisarcina polymorpha]|uniref:histidine kinase n=1 Tax=Acidisarcina polymorpha TaxID=2211140 RepID=A0A2Z5G9Y7_9BACT|nr:HAMP domain-containing sensor histidine kinase [Acidisarcina polymorpha]AXC16082.1 putative two-component sensor histidine kinase [Acidisarcina polymorpha]
MDDITIADLEAKLALATEALRKSEERATAGMLALEVMHDIRNPLEALRNLTYLASLEANNPDQVRRYTALAEEQMAIALDIANSTLSFAKAPMNPRSVNLVVLAEAALRIHQRTIEAKQVRLLKDLPGDVAAPVYTGEILQVLSNLIHNALDALQPDGTLCLRCRQRQEEVHLVIADNGHGIPHEHVKNIFKPFFSTKGGQGTGLGLALSKRIVERHRGTIKVRSSARPGRSGTIFKISIPA